MTSTTAPAALALSPAGEYVQYVETGRPETSGPRTYRKYLVDEHLIVTAYDKPNRVAEVHVNVADPADIKIVILRQKARGGDYARPVGSVEDADTIRTGAQHGVALVRVLARAEIALADDEGDEEPDREPSAEQEVAWDAREDDARGHALGDTEPDALAGTPLADDAPLGTIRFHDGSEDAPRCPCGNDVQGDGFRPVTVAESTDGKVGVFIDPDGAWHALGRHVACLADYCLRVWSDRDITTDGTGTWAPVTTRLHHVAEPTVEAFSTTPTIEAGMDRNAASWAAVELADRIRAAYPVTDGRDGFLSDPGGWIAYLELTDDDATAAAAIELIRAETV